MKILEAEKLHQQIPNKARILPRMPLWKQKEGLKCFNHECQPLPNSASVHTRYLTLSFVQSKIEHWQAHLLITNDAGAGNKVGCWLLNVDSRVRSWKHVLKVQLIELQKWEELFQAGLVPEVMVLFIFPIDNVKWLTVGTAWTGMKLSCLNHSFSQKVNN